MTKGSWLVPTSHVQNWSSSLNIYGLLTPIPCYTQYHYGNDCNVSSEPIKFIKYFCRIRGKPPINHSVLKQIAWANFLLSVPVKIILPKICCNIKFRCVLLHNLISCYDYESWVGFEGMNKNLAEWKWKNKT